MLCAFCRSNEADDRTEKLEVQVFGSTDWMLFQQLVLASLAGERALAAFGSIPDLAGPPSGTKLH